MVDFRDDFWDIEKLIPKKKSTVAPFSTKPKSVEVSIAEEEKAENAETKLTLSHVESKNELVSYEVNAGLLRKVSITKFTDKYDFYGNFRKAALVYYDFKTEKCDFAPFYSYMPQYSQLNPQQKSFYFYWRDCVRRGKYIKTDYSYFYLHVYEIINLPDKIPADKGLDMLLTLWKTYRADLPNIDRNMSLWVEDYCLLYRLSLPMERIADFIFDVIVATEFKEFYLSDIKTMGIDGMSAMLAYLSEYDWRRGKYAGGDNRAAYEKHMLGAMSRLIYKIFECEELYSESASTTRLSRSAFKNSLCTHSVKCRLEVDYVPLAKAENLRSFVTAAVRYTENKLRAFLGVKSRLAVKDLPDDYKYIIDSYFDEAFERVNRERVNAAKPEYEKLYDACSEALSFEGADEIERESWSTTARLVAESDDDVIIPVLNPEASNEKTETDEVGEALECGLNITELRFINAVRNLDTDEIKRISDEAGMMPDSFAETINEKTSESFGDVIIEGDYPEMGLIEDYEEDIEKWLTILTK